MPPERGLTPGEVLRPLGTHREVRIPRESLPGYSCENMATFRSRKKTATDDLAKVVNRGKV